MHPFGETASLSGGDRNTFASYLPRLTQMLNWNAAEIVYAHNVTGTPVGATDTGIDFAEDLVEWLLDNRSSLAFITPMDLALATYLRPGPVQVNSINEWVTPGGTILC